MKNKWIFLAIIFSLFIYGNLKATPVFAQSNNAAAIKQISVATTSVVKSEKIVKVYNFVVKTAQISVYAAKAEVKKVTSRANYSSLMKRLANVQIRINARAKTIALAKSAAMAKTIAVVAIKQISLATTYVLESENIVKEPDFIVKTSQLSVYAAKAQVQKVLTYGSPFRANYNSLVKRLANVQIKINARANAIAALKQIDIATTYVLESESNVVASDLVVKTSQLSVYAASTEVEKVASYGSTFKASYASLVLRLANVQMKINIRAAEIAVAAIENAPQVTASDLINANRLWKTALTAVATVKDITLAADLTVRLEAVEPPAISLSKTTDALGIADVDALSATITPSTTTNEYINWESSNSEIATVDTVGNVTAISTGSAIITATASDGRISATCNVIVTEWTPEPDPPTPPSNKALIFAIDIGHNAKYDSGAVGIRSEDACTKEVGTLVIEKLRELGYTAIDCTPTNATSTTNALKQRVDIANAAHADYYLAIHFNIFNGIASGSEVYMGSSRIKTQAQQVLNNLVSLGYVNRGLKDNSRGLYVLKNSNMPSMLVECSFLDSASDMARYDANEIADALVDGLTTGN